MNNKHTFKMLISLFVLLCPSKGLRSNKMPTWGCKVLQRQPQALARYYVSITRFLPFSLIPQANKCRTITFTARFPKSPKMNF